jgi:hypothetical protein
MSTIINATTTNGVVIQPDNSGSLVLQTNSGTTALTIDTSQRAAFVAGTAALPAITTTGDTNTGIFFPAADTIAFSEGGTESMRIDSSGIVTGTVGNLMLISSTSQTTTSGTSKDFTSIPSWVKRITIMFNGVSTNGTSNLLLQIGAGSVTTSGYVSCAGGAPTGNAITGATSTAGYLITSFNASTYVVYGNCQINLLGSNTWIESGNITSSSGTIIWTNGGSIALGGTLDRVRITTVNGTDTFDAGSINILYE